LVYRSLYGHLPVNIKIRKWIRTYSVSWSALNNNGRIWLKFFRLSTSSVTISLKVSSVSRQNPMKTILIADFHPHLCCMCRSSSLLPPTLLLPLNLLRLAFHCYKGGDPLGWLYQAEQFFEYHQTPMAQQIHITSFNLDGEALQ
jgi:hypothetical protein